MRGMIHKLHDMVLFYNRYFSGKSTIYLQQAIFVLNEKMKKSKKA